MAAVITSLALTKEKKKSVETQPYQQTNELLNNLILPAHLGISLCVHYAMIVIS